MAPQIKTRLLRTVRRVTVVAAGLGAVAMLAGCVGGGSHAQGGSKVWETRPNKGAICLRELPSICLAPPTLRPGETNVIIAWHFLRPIHAKRLEWLLESLGTATEERPFPASVPDYVRRRYIGYHYGVVRWYNSKGNPSNLCVGHVPNLYVVMHFCIRGKRRAELPVLMVWHGSVFQIISVAATERDRQPECLTLVKPSQGTKALWFACRPQREREQRFVMYPITRTARSQKPKPKPSTSLSPIEN